MFQGVILRSWLPIVTIEETSSGKSVHCLLVGVVAVKILSVVVKHQVILEHRRSVAWFVEHYIVAKSLPKMLPEVFSI